MTWWLSASPAELKAASTCRECGEDGCDIDLGLCFDCFGKWSAGDRWRMNASIARKYGLYDRAAECEARALEADAEESRGGEEDPQRP